MTTFSLAALPEHLLQDVICKMSIKDLYKMRSTSSSMNTFIESRSRILPTRVEKGLTAFLAPYDGIVQIKIGNRLIEITEGFEKQFLGIPFKDIHMETGSATPEQIQEMIKGLEAWKPICWAFHTHSQLPEDDFYAMLEHVGCLGHLKIRISEANQVARKVEKLQKIGNPGAVEMLIYKNYETRELYKEIKDFGKFNAKISGKTAALFLRDLATSSESTNLVDINVSLTSAIVDDFECHYETLLEASGLVRPSKRQAAFKIYLLLLKDNKLAIVGHTIPAQPSPSAPESIRVLIIPDNNDFQFVSMIQTCLKLGLEDEEKEKIVAAPMEEKLKMIKEAFQTAQRR